VGLELIESARSSFDVEKRVGRGRRREGEKGIISMEIKPSRRKESPRICLTVNW
jgi:hypothetical protein